MHPRGALKKSQTLGTFPIGKIGAGIFFEEDFDLDDEEYFPFRGDSGDRDALSSLLRFRDDFRE